MSQNQNLIPRLGLFSATMVVIGSIIGSGIFKKIAPMSLKLQSPYLVLLCWVAAGLITLFGALTYAEIAGRLAQTGGLYAYLRNLFGPFWAFIFGWSCFAVIQSASIASIAFVFAEAFRQIRPDFFPTLSTSAIAALTIFILTTINSLGLLLGAWIENILTLIKILGLLVITGLAFSLTSPTMTETFTTRLQPPQGLSLTAVFFSAMLSAFWAYDGLNNIGFIGGEVKNPQRTLPRALIFGVGGILIIYLTVNTAFFQALPFQEILSISALKDKIFAVEFIHVTYGASWSFFVAILILISTLGATNGSILSSARIYFSMARDGLFFRWVGQVNSKTRTPVLSLALQGVWSCALVFLGSFDTLTDMLIFASFFFYGLGAWGLLKTRKSAKIYNGFRAPTWIVLTYLVFCFCLVLVTFFQDPMGSAKGLLLIFLGLPLYFFFRKGLVSS